jgi:crossover junction endodeoxyribonuclease RuvC
VRVIGIDPGTAKLGYGVIESGDQPELIDFGIVETGLDDGAAPQRLEYIYQGVQLLLDRHRPEAMAIEQLFFARNVTTAIGVGQARGVTLLAAAQANIDVFEYTPSQIKHAIAGYGKADKQQMQEMVRILLGLAYAPQPDDAADALAVAITHSHRRRFAELTREGEA